MSIIMIPPPCPPAHREVNGNCVPCPNPTDIVFANVCITCPRATPFYVINGGVCVAACPPGTFQVGTGQLCEDSPR